MSRFNLGFGFAVRSMLFLTAASSVSACQTAFMGSAEFPGGARGCYDECRKQGMQMASFVFVGEYSSACACKPLTAPAAPATPAAPAASAAPASRSESTLAESDDASYGAIVAAAAGVELQRRRRQEQRSYKGF